MAQIFISYSHKDKKSADKICSILEELTIDYFRDEKDIDWGDSIADEVHLALDEITAIIVLVSNDSLKSEWVHYEIGYARALRKTVLPYIIDSPQNVPKYIRDLRHLSDLNTARKYLENYPSTGRSTIDIAYTQEANDNTVSLFRKAQALMPKLFAEMSNTIKSDETRLIREFFVLPTEGLMVNSSMPRFAYYEDQHENLKGQITLLDQYGFIYDVAFGNTPIYRFTEEFIELLLQL